MAKKKKKTKDLIHKKIAENMEWCELAHVIIDLECEKAELVEYMTKKEINKHDKLIEIYENQKQKKLNINKKKYKNDYWTELHPKSEYGSDFVARWSVDDLQDLI